MKKPTYEFVMTIKTVIRFMNANRVRDNLEPIAVFQLQ
jgi:hypothetical protein